LILPHALFRRQVTEHISFLMINSSREIGSSERPVDSMGLRASSPRPSGPSWRSGGTIRRCATIWRSWSAAF
jgi:hypothetical protein